MPGAAHNTVRRVMQLPVPQPSLCRVIGDGCELWEQEERAACFEKVEGELD